MPGPIGYARVSTSDQDTGRQFDELRAAGCTILHQEHASGARRARPVLAALLRQIGQGDTLVVVKLDRLARSLEHLLEVVRTLEGRGAFLRVLGDPIDTATPQGRFMLQMLGAVAEFERSLIRERVASGLARAARQGRRGGNPALRARDPIEALEAVLLRRGVPAESLAAARGEAEAEMRAAREAARAAPWPDPASAWADAQDAGAAGRAA